MASYNSIRQEVHVWPPQNQPSTIGSKIQLIQNLDYVAANVTRSTRPKTIQIKCPQDISHRAVIKRTHSDTGYHVLMPDDPRRNWDFITQNSEIPKCLWFSQSYVEPLDKLGEWRVLMVGGRIMYVVHTHASIVGGDRQWKWEMVHDFYSLDELA